MYDVDTISQKQKNHSISYHFQSCIYKLIRAGVKCFFPKYTAIGIEHLPEEPCVIIANHAQMNGPIVSQLCMPRRVYCWCREEMMHLKEVPDYAYKDFWSMKPKIVRWFFRILSYLIAPLSVCVFNQADCIGVYFDFRIRDTFKASTEHLSNGYDVMVFPENKSKHNHIINDLTPGFVDVAKMHHKGHQKPLAFVPAYICPAFKQIIFGKPIYYDPNTPIKEERQRITSCLKNSITEIAVKLPKHRIVPYDNIAKKDYPYNQ